MYGVGVVHGILRARQMFGSVGLSQNYPLDSAVFCHALETLTGAAEKSGTELPDDMICELLTNVSKVQGRWGQGLGREVRISG